MTGPTATHPAIQPYQSVAEIETPTLLVDLDVMERNMRRMSTLAARHDVGLRSHAKTHKVPELARRQERLPRGTGVLCQTLGEAEVMARHGVADVHLVRMAATERKVDRLVWLSEKLEHFSTTVDGTENVEPLQRAAARRGSTVNVLLEVNVGLDRCGVEPGRAAELAEAIDGKSNLVFEGIMAHEGFVTGVADSRDDLRRRCDAVVGRIERAVDRIEASGLAVDRVVSGATATAEFVAPSPVVTEIDPGRYLFYDGVHVRDLPQVTKADCAVSVLTTVVSKPTRDRAIVDAGNKTLTLVAEPTPIPRFRDDVHFHRMSSEHGYLDVSDARKPIEVGDRLEFIVPKVSHAINLSDVLVGVRNGEVEEVWEVFARGKST